ncbi:hypothetical protein J3Q64DRAFT_1767453 [Phycomyces blakesleeanus]|uniref:Uncharacterized protein n=2 Tax=Phycomyces blakesleeanus TaxID=4837 RepID=A0A162NK92_PHYB8|nr:hypothetical protein PHYBLDRAFT_167325 [Phycomyces blakesleeanus NRRL 1555(-)]OAD74998.1 hypothetical protein PHYBLDRAFT_167325 [Phycomyces blakesleeanus NRRL 1555(-)]|eukprot:XP_018293038.1 hypothetical protein PHYBLDRAFT_167325 [Phycomyces blakesleeanus NRRL 1555(-)]
MTFTYGYEIASPNGQLGHVIPPPLLGKKISVSSAANTNRWIFYGTRKEIVDWIRQHPDIVLENAVFAGGRPTTYHTHTEIVIDLLQMPDAEQSYYDYFKSFVVSDYATERVKVEIRPRVESKDQSIITLCRVIVASGTRLGDVVDELEREWAHPAASYYQQAVDTFNDNPGPVHIISTDAPMAVHVDHS